MALHFVHYEYHFASDQRLDLPVYAGSLWRGIFGKALREASCVTRQSTCEQCLLRQSCVYSYVFETPIPVQDKSIQSFDYIPHPFVLRSLAGDNQKVRLQLILFGKKSLEYGAHVTHAMQRMGQLGVGKRRVKMRLEEVLQYHQLQWKSVYSDGGQWQPVAWDEYTVPDVPAGCELHFLTPLRLKSRGHNIRPENFSFQDLFRQLLRRIHLLQSFHQDEKTELDFPALIAQAGEISWNSSSLKWYDWKRYSSRQKESMNMGGIVGNAAIVNQDLQAFWPWLWLGQWTHAGKGTSLGLGQYQIRTLA